MQSPSQVQQKTMTPVLGQLRIDTTTGNPIQVPVMDGAGRDVANAYHVFGCARPIQGDHLTQVIPVRIEHAYFRRSAVHENDFVLSTGVDLQELMQHVTEEELLQELEAVGFDELVGQLRDRLQAIGEPRLEEARARAEQEVLDQAQRAAGGEPPRELRPVPEGGDGGQAEEDGPVADSPVDGEG